MTVEDLWTLVEFIWNDPCLFLCRFQLSSPNRLKSQKGVVPDDLMPTVGVSVAVRKEDVVSQTAVFSEGCHFYCSFVCLCGCLKLHSWAKHQILTFKALTSETGDFVCLCKATQADQNIRLLYSTRLSYLV